MLEVMSFEVPAESIEFMLGIHMFKHINDSYHLNVNKLNDN